MPYYCLYRETCSSVTWAIVDSAFVCKVYGIVWLARLNVCVNRVLITLKSLNLLDLLGVLQGNQNCKGWRKPQRLSNLIRSELLPCKWSGSLKLLGVSIGIFWQYDDEVQNIIRMMFLSCDILSLISYGNSHILWVPIALFFLTETESKK